MATLKIGTRQEWLAALTRLLEAKKELTRKSEALTQQRLELPWVPIEKSYRFDTDEGTASLEDLFKGRSQLLIVWWRRHDEYDAASK